MATTSRLSNGSGVSRRDLIRLGAGGLGFGLFGGLGPVPYVLAQASRATAASTSGKILVVFEWFGGNDGLNTVVPYGDPMYYKHRPTIGIKERDLLKIDAQFGWHKSMRGVKQLYDEGKVAIVQGVGYDQPSFSHFTSVSYWHTAAPNSGNEYGWMGRTAIGARSCRRARQHDRQHLRQPDAGGQGREPRAAGVHRSDQVPARRVRAGKSRARCARRAARAGRRRASLRDGSDAERRPGIRRRAGRVEQIPGPEQSRSAPARPRQGRGAHRSRLSDAALLRAAAREPLRHARQPGIAARSAARILRGRRRGFLPGNEAHRAGGRCGDVHPQRVRPARAGEHEPRHRSRHGAGELRDRQRREGRALRHDAEPDAISCSATTSKPPPTSARSTRR